MNVPRVDVMFGARAAWWYPAATTPAPCVVMAHGISLTRGDGLDLYARAFAAAGAHVLAFDHRYLGDSGGTPRQRFRPSAQRDDWRAAVDYVRTRPEVDPARIVLWGFSFSGGHVANLLVHGIDVAAAMVLCPFVNGLARLRATPVRLTAWIVPRAVADAVGRHTIIPVTGPPGSHAAMTLAGEADGFAAAHTSESTWRNEISPAVFLQVPLIRLYRQSRRIRVPLWVGRCRSDVTVDFDSAGKLARRAPLGEVHDFDGDHFAPFGGSVTEAVLAAQTEFLRRTVLA